MTNSGGGGANKSRNIPWLKIVESYPIHSYHHHHHHNHLLVPHRPLYEIAHSMAQQNQQWIKDSRWPAHLSLYKCFHSNSDSSRPATEIGHHIRKHLPVPLRVYRSKIGEKSNHPKTKRLSNTSPIILTLVKSNQSEQEWMENVTLIVNIQREWLYTFPLTFTKSQRNYFSTSQFYRSCFYFWRNKTPPLELTPIVKVDK